MQTIFDRYHRYPGNIGRVFRSICNLLSGRLADLDWSGFDVQDWQLFRKMAVDEGVAEMVYYTLKCNPESCQLNNFDPDAYAQLSKNEAVTAIRNAVMFKDLAKILEVLTGQNIPVVLLKGCDFANTIYPESGLRSMGDLDLLVPANDFEKALDLVHGIGFNEYLPEAFAGLDGLMSHHAHLRKLGPTNTILELHWTLVGASAFKFAFDIDWFWKNIEPVSKKNTGSKNLGSAGVYHFIPDANILYLSAHQMLQHGGERVDLRWLVDLMLLFKAHKDQINWQNLIDQADRLGLKGTVRAALSAEQECFKLDLPEILISFLNEQPDEKDSFVNLKASKSPTRTVSEYKKLSSLNWKGRLRLLAALVFPSPAYMQSRYRINANWQIPFFYLYRWFDIGWDGLKTLLKMAQVE